MDYIERFMRFKWGYSRYFTVHDFLKGKPPKGKKVYVIGSSVARDSINCSMMDSAFPKYSFYNLGLPCHSTKTIADDFELNLLINHAPDLIILGTHPFLMSDYYPVKKHFFLKFYEKAWRAWLPRYRWRAIPGTFFPSPGHLHDLKDSRLRQYPWSYQELNVRMSFKKKIQDKALTKIRRAFSAEKIDFMEWGCAIGKKVDYPIYPVIPFEYLFDDVHYNKKGYVLSTNQLIERLSWLE